MQNSRDRLIELLDEAFIKSDDNFGMPNTMQFADYLIENGVIVLPKGEEHEQQRQTD